jgi:hypothetical protein
MKPLEAQQMTWKPNGTVRVEGTPHSQQVDKYQAKVGLAGKTYKLRKDIAELFAQACEELEVSQARVLTAYMVNFIRRYAPETNEELKDLPNLPKVHPLKEVRECEGNRFRYSLTMKPTNG